MIIPYVGTVKAAVALPLFALFGIGPATARFAGILLGGLGVAGLTIFLARRISAAAGLLTGLLLAINPSYLDFTVFDNGGASLWMASLGLVSLALLHHLRRHSAASAFLLGVAAGLGVWARLNVLWMLAALALAGALAFGRRAVPARGPLAAMAAGGFLGALPLIAYEVGSGVATWKFIQSTREPASAARALRRLQELAETMVSAAEQRALWAGPRLPWWQVGFGAFLFGLALLCAVLPRPLGAPDISRWRRFFGIASLAATALFCASGLNVSQHHLVGVLPLAIASLALLMVEFWPRRRLVVPLLAALGVLALLSGYWDVRIQRSLRATGGTWFWSSALDEAAGYLEARAVAPSRLKILTWGLHPNLYVASGGAVHGTDLFWGATSQLSSRGLTWDAEIREGGSFLLHLSPAGSAPLDAASTGFRRAYDAYAGPRRETRFFDRSGMPMVLLVEVEPAASPGRVGS